MIRATIVLLAASLVIPRLRARSAAERHLLWTVSLAAAAALPLLGVLLPVWQPEWARHLVVAWPASLTALQPWAGTGPDVVIRATGVEPLAWTLGDWVTLTWIVGAALTLLALGSEVVKLVRLLGTAQPVTDARQRRISSDVTRALRLSRAPLLLHSARAAIPITWGVRHPRVLLPTSAVDWPDERLWAVLAHELAHIRRGDWLVHVLAQMVCAVYWFHPLFWLTERGLSRESEQAADDDVLRLGLEGGTFATHLLAIVRVSRASMSARAPIVAMARRSHLERRVAALLSASANRSPVRLRTAVVAAGVTIALAVPLAALTNGGVGIDVDVRTLNLPSLSSATPSPGATPELPAVRLVRTPRETAATIVAPSIQEYTTPPLYSDEARRRHVEGIVSIGVRVDEDGRLTRASVVRSLGFGLDQNALVALRQWRFRAGTADGTARPMDAEIDVEFSLKSEAVNELIANDMATLVGPGVTPPRAVERAAPSSSGRHARGTVVLDVVLEEDGTPKVLRILRSSTPDADEVAVRHFGQWRFSPAMKDGRPVKVRMNVEVTFHG